MSLTAFPTGVSSFGIVMAGNQIPSNIGQYLWVNGAFAGVSGNGLSPESAISTIQGAVDIADNNAVIMVAPGAYDETVTIARGTGPLTIVGLGNMGDAAIAPSTLAAKGLVNASDDVTLINLGVAGESTATSAIVNTGSRLRLFGCKLEGVDTSGACLTTGPGTVVQVAAHTQGNSGDILIQGCEFAWAFNGLELKTSDYGTPTQIYVVNCRFQNVSNACVLGTPGAFGIDSVRNLELVECVFDNMEDGTAPTKYLSIDGTTDTGIITGCRFATATNNKAVLDVENSAIAWVANMTEAGVSTAKPS